MIMLKVGFGADHSKPMQLWNLSTTNENKQQQLEPQKTDMIQDSKQS